MRTSPFLLPLLLAPLAALACGRTSLLLDDIGQGGGGGSSSESSSESSSQSSSVSSSVSSVVSSSSTGVVCTIEVCNGIDDDCDGLTDEDIPDIGVPCFTGLQGDCGQGTTACVFGAFTCQQIIFPKAEICGNVHDEDCNGIYDDCSTTAGCSDGTREGFVDEMLYPFIAGCSGGWGVPGVLKAPVPSCGFQGGNTGMYPIGTDCSAADLCAPGFHVCKGASDVASRSPTGCAGVTDTPGLFFTTREGSTGCAVCTIGSLTDPGICNGSSCAQNCASNDSTANDLFGCGTLGQDTVYCGVLDKTSANLCQGLGFPWKCTNDIGEANDVVKFGSEGGGVLCCAD